MSTEVRETSLRALRQPGTGWYVLAGALSTVVLVGLFAWVHQLRYGMGAAGYNDHAFWAVYIADVITFLASDNARFMTGQIVAVNGGKTAA